MRTSRAELVWALSWAAGISAAGLVAVAGLPYVWQAGSLAGVISLLLIGVPVRASAIAAGSRRPTAEAVAFAAVCAAAVLTYAYVFSPQTGPNINTTATMEARRQHPPIFNAPPELLLGLCPTVGAAMTGALAGARIGVPSHARVRRHLDVALIHAVSVAGALVLGFGFLGVAGLFILALTGPLAILGGFVHGLAALVLGGFVAGSIVGALVTSLRRRLEPPI